MLAESQKQHILIVGADSFIGRETFRIFNSQNYKVLGTTRRSLRVDSSHIFLDLADSPSKWQIPLSISSAIICAGVTKLQECRKNQKKSEKINVVGVTALIEKLVEQEIFTIFLSTNQVFDGSKPYSRTDDAISPITEYGRQKAEVESRISRYLESVAIIRLTKVLGGDVQLFREWFENLREGRTINPCSDMRISPVPISCVVTILQLVIEKHISGILQVSGNRDLAYDEIALLGTKILGFDEALVKPIRCADILEEQIPENTTMDIERLRDVFGIEPPDVEWTIKSIFSKLVHLCNNHSN